MPGSGKSTVSKILAHKLKIKMYSVGVYRREMAKKRNISIDKLNKLGEQQDFTDKEADEWQKNLNKEDNFIIDGRLSFYFIPNSIKIFLDVNPKTGAGRVYNHDRKEEKSETKEEALEMIKERVISDIKRYKKYYNLNPYDKEHYDLVIDTSSISAEKAAEEILKFIKLKNK